jgi:hypothetical protein
MWGEAWQTYRDTLRPAPEPEPEPGHQRAQDANAAARAEQEARWEAMGPEGRKERERARMADALKEAGEAGAVLKDAAPDMRRVIEEKMAVLSECMQSFNQGYRESLDGEMGKSEEEVAQEWEDMTKMVQERVVEESGKSASFLESQARGAGVPMTAMAAHDTLLNAREAVKAKVAQAQAQAQARARA